jgi:hypothetical protein
MFCSDVVLTSVIEEITKFNVRKWINKSINGDMLNFNFILEHGISQINL